MPLTASRPSAVSTPAILWLGSPGSTRRHTVGRKSANLSAVASIGRVPPGFAISAATLAELPAGEPLPDELRAAITVAYRQLAGMGTRPAPEVAVRTSAIGEDGISFAGRHHAYLNVVGADAVIAAIEACLASAASTRARNDAGFALLVQQMVRADVSVALFSVNPLSGDTSEAVITASWGLGAGLAGSTAAPDTWFIERDSRQIIEQHVGTKERMTVAAAEDAGVRQVDVPGALRYLPTLSTRQLGELMQLAEALEARMGWPVDVECAYRDGELYVLRCRPITTLEVSSLAA